MLAEFVNALAKTYQSDEAQPYYARPSMAGPDRCIRALTYQALGVKAEYFPGRAIMAMDDSSWHEELTIQWMERSVLKVHSRQMPVDIPAPGINPYGFWCSVCKKNIPAEMIHGHIDWIIQPPTGFEVLAEHKALSHFQCQKIETGEDGYLPMDNIVQTCIYSKGLQLVQPNLSRIVLIIKNKNTAQFIELEGDYNAETDTLLIERKIISRGDAPAEIVQMMTVIERPVSNAFDKFREVQRYAGLKTLPVRPFSYDTDFPCGYCRWGKLCWSTFYEEFLRFPENVTLSKEIEQKAIEYKKLGAIMNQTKKEHEEIKEELRAAVMAIPAKSGRAGQFLIELKPYEETDIDEALVPPAAFSKSTHYRFNMKKIKTTPMEDENAVQSNQKQSSQSSDPAPATG